MNMFPRTAKIKGSCQSFSEHRMQSWAPQFNWIMWKMHRSWNLSDDHILSYQDLEEHPAAQGLRTTGTISIPFSLHKPGSLASHNFKKSNWLFLICFVCGDQLNWKKKNATHFDLTEIQDSVKCGVQGTQHTESYSEKGREFFKCWRKKRDLDSKLPDRFLREDLGQY